MSARYPVLVSLLVVLGHAPGHTAPQGPSTLILKNYPPESLARGEQGTVEFAVELDRDASIESCVVTKSSGYPRLDAATCDLIVRFAAFAPTEADGTRVATTKTGKIEWRLPQEYRRNASSAPKPLMVTSAELETQRLICKRSNTAGSLIRLKTYCLTRHEWAQAQQNGQRDVRDMINTRQSPHGCYMAQSHRC